MLRRSLIPCLEAALRERLRYALRWELRDKRGSSLLNSLLAMMGTFLRSPSPGPPRPVLWRPAAATAIGSQPGAWNVCSSDRTKIR
ncbi:MAG: hypothetical protein IIC64_20185 [SAR324 cluster bacterium]|nr:hypothetical protein [SAR324 cluster bacterium]